MEVLASVVQSLWMSMPGEEGSFISWWRPAQLCITSHSAFAYTKMSSRNPGLIADCTVQVQWYFTNTEIKSLKPIKN